MFNLKNEELTRLLIVVGCGVLLLFLIKTYYYDNAVESAEEADPTALPTEEGFYDFDQSSPVEDHQAFENQEYVEQNSPEGNEMGLGAQRQLENSNVSNVGQVMPSECNPKDVLSSQDLLPGGADSKYAQVVPSGQGSLTDQNFLNAGHHTGVNSVGSCLRNANLQLRSEFPNPQVTVSPWSNTTIAPDLHRRPLE